MRLSRRIYAIADKVNKGESAADIGTDHGYVPMLLVRGGISDRVIMSDISEGSLAKARETFAQCGLYADPADFRTGDGLAPIAPGETDVVIIAGLGGHTIAEILDADIIKARSFRRLILQPRKHSGYLRQYLYEHGWDITSEALVKEGKFACEIITAVPSEETSRKPLYPSGDIRWMYPPCLRDCADPELVRDRVGWKISSIEETLANLEGSSGDTAALADTLRSQIDYLRTLL